ncbi:MAG TPA: TonB-dependent receptor [Thermoanaerobaculia bacterium]
MTHRTDYRTRVPDRRGLFALILLIAFAAAPLLGQGTALTTSLSGVVTSNGQPLAGVGVTVSSPSLQGTRTAVTSSSGVYQFAGLPPGEYTAVFEFPGMQNITRKVSLALASPARLDSDMVMAGVAEAVEVGAAIAAPLERTDLAASFPQTEIAKLPVSRNIRDTVLMSPGVTPNGVNNQITISGAPSYDNIFLVNGVVVNENLRGQPQNLFIEDAIQETTVLSGGGISAEYGLFTGGVVSTITRSGGNDFHGSYRATFTNPDWLEKTPIETTDHIDNVDIQHEATLGGRIIRDRLWFFGAGRLFERSVASFTAFTTLPYTNAFDETRWEAKLTGQIASGHTLSGSYIDITNDETNNAFAPILDYESIVPSRSLPNTLLSANYSGMLGRNVLVELQYSEREFSFVNSGGRFTDRIQGTWIQETVARGGRYNAPVFCGVCTPEERNNEAWQAKVTYFFNKEGWGDHSIAAGVGDFFEERIANNYQSASQYQITANTLFDANNVPYPRFDTTTTLTWRPIFDLSSGTDFATFSAYINDTWNLNKHWTFNVGLRYDQNDGKDAAGNLVSDDSAFSPRLGVIFDPKGDGRNRFSASYGRYVTKISDGNVGGSAQANGNPATFSYSYTGPVINAAGTPIIPTREALAQLFAWFEAGGGTNRTPDRGSFYPGYGALFPESIASPIVDEFTIGWGTRIGNDAFVKIDGVWRDWGNFYANQLNLETGQLTDPRGNTGDVSWTVNSEEISREYRGVQFQGEWRPGRFSAGVYYTYSTLEGNDEGEGAGTATIRNLPLGIYYPEYLGYDERLPVGDLGQDQRHRAALTVAYDFVTGFGVFNMGLIQRVDSGRPYSAIASIDATGRTAGTAYTGLPANPGYTLSQIGTTHNYFISERGEFRTGDVWNTDLAITYTTPALFGVLEFFVQGQVRNLFDNSEAIFTDATVITRRTSSTSGLAPWNPFTETPVEGTHYRLGPNFGKPTAVTHYQRPQEFLFSAGLRF